MGKSFLQSSEWLDFQKSLGRKVWRIEGLLVIKHNLPFGKSYLYSPRPNFAKQNLGGRARFKEILEKIRKIAKQENAIFFRLEPENKIDLEKFKFKKSKNIQPTKTLILDITKSEQELLNQMHYKTRYNIGLSKKKGVKIKKDKNYFEEFWRLIEETTKRDKFRPHPKEYYQKMLEVPGVELFVAEYPVKSSTATNGASKNKIIAANIVVFYPPLLFKSGGQATYLHGASDYKYRNLMAPHLLQWEQILEAKKRGCVEYDFWGIDEKKWPGVTRFKKGFGGKEIFYPGAYDLVFQPIWYLIYKIARSIL